MADADKGAAFLDKRAKTRARITTPMQLRGQIEGMWDAGLPPGDKTGWPSLDRFYTVVPGQVTLVTGWPSSGKSEWLDALLVNLSRQGWKFALFSPENQPTELHVTKLAEKITGKPFGAGPSQRIPKDDLPEVLYEIEESFGWITHPEGDSLSVASVLAIGEEHLAQYPDSPRGLVMDPWNELEHWRPPGLSETEYVSKTLSTIRNWARPRRVHVWLVAHPQKMPRENGKLPIPKPDMISGSQNWWNKADNCITVYRDLAETERNEVDIYVQKVRFKHVGRPGRVELLYDRITGRYSEPGRNIYDTKAGRA